MDSLRYDALTSLRTHKKKLPKYLWRVQHGDSQATFDAKCNLLAAIFERIPTTHYELRASLTRHLKWGYSRAQSHFVSTFDSYHLAVEWARAKLPLSSPHDDDDESDDMQIYRIRTAKLRDDTMVFNVERLVKRLGIDVGREGLEREFVVLNMIPYKSLDFIETISTPHPQPPRPRSTSPRSTPWRRTLSRRSQFFAPVAKSPAAVSNQLELLVSQHLERVQNEKQAEEVFYWVQAEQEVEVSDEVEVSAVSDEGEEEEDAEREDSVIELREKLRSWLGEG